jgi:hypothetical protein
VYRPRNIDKLFFMLGVGTMWFKKKRFRTRDTKIVFLHPVGSEGHVVYSSASMPCDINTIFFMLGWNWYRFYKKRAGTHYAELVFLHPVGYAGHVVHSATIQV